MYGDDRRARATLIAARLVEVEAQRLGLPGVAVDSRAVGDVVLTVCGREDNVAVACLLRREVGSRGEERDENGQA